MSKRSVHAPGSGGGLCANSAANSSTFAAADHSAIPTVQTSVSWAIRPAPTAWAI
jgi:hypothetical protein